MNNSHVQQPLECNTSIIMKPSSLFCVERPAETHGFLRGAVSEHGLQSGPALHAEQPLVSFTALRRLVNCQKFLPVKFTLLSITATVCQRALVITVTVLFPASQPGNRLPADVHVLYGQWEL